VRPSHRRAGTAAGVPERTEPPPSERRDWVEVREREQGSGEPLLWPSKIYNK